MHLFWEQKIKGSNPFFPTHIYFFFIFKKTKKKKKIIKLKMIEKYNIFIKRIQLININKE